jgi:hypothetical protein
VSDEVWGIFVEDGPTTQLLVAAYEEEADAISHVEEEAERAWDEAIDDGAGDGEADRRRVAVIDSHEIDLIPRSVVDFDLLARGFAQKFIVRA